jgi:hypothetical protein
MTNDDDPLEQLWDDLARLCNDPAVGDGLRAASAALARDGPDGRILMSALEWIAEQNRGPVEKFKAIEKLVKFSRSRRFVHIENMRDFCGWSPESEKPRQN